MTTENEITSTRRARFEDILSGYDAEGPDGSIPGASSSPERYALVSESLRAHGYFATYCATPADVERAAAANISGGWQPVCYFDLDTLAGDDPPPAEGDVVDYGDVRYHVVHLEDDTAQGVLFHWLYLHPRTSEPDGWIDDPLTEKVDERDCAIVERANPDERMPVRFGVAKIQTMVAFDRVATERQV